MIGKFALTAALIVAGSAAVQAKSYDIELTGFCNQFTLTTDGFEVWGSRGGCADSEVDGGSIAKISGTTWMISNDTNDSEEIFTWYFTPPKHKAGNWFLYESTTTGQSEINSGTYTVVRHFAPRSSGPNVTLLGRKH